jgi:hypothetical protein
MQSQITHFSQQSKQRRLVDNWSDQLRIAILFQYDGHALKPVCPLIAQMAFEPDLINDWLTWIRFWFPLG